jgi:ADP-heptose:LPS heptosyltransferase
MPDDNIEATWMAAMRRGDFARAWATSDRVLADRIARNGFDFTLPRHRQAIWNGRPLAGKHVLVRCYHGLGDTIMFIRFAKRLRAIARSVTVWVQPLLMPLVARVDGVERVLPLHDGVPDMSYDVDIEVMELAHALRIMQHELADDVPYLQAPNIASLVPASGSLRVGLIWSAGDWDRRRSIRLADLAPLMDVPGVTLFSLQRGTAARETSEFLVRDIGSDDVQFLAAALRDLDLLVSIDSFGAHLAGAMARPAWVLLRKSADWRWGEREKSVWYPTLHLFRQEEEGEWHAAISKLANELSAPAVAQRGAMRLPEQSHPCDVRTENEHTLAENREG